MFSIFRRVMQLCFFTCICNAAIGQTIEFNSLDKKQGFPALLSGRAQYTDKINGVFTRPAGATGNVPVMVIMHGSAGVSEDGTGAWSKYFLNLGLATFVVDSLTPRGIIATGGDQSQLGYSGSTVDALLALKAVSTQPGVDSSRIGVIGFSRGAFAAAASSFENVRAAVLGADSRLRFGLHVAYYGGCNAVGTTTGAPIAIFIGTADDYVTAETCTANVEALRAKGANVDFTVYQGAHHGFDLVKDRDMYRPQVQNYRGCVLNQNLDDLTYSADGKLVTTKEYGDYLGKCLTRGITVGYSSSAASDAQKKVRAMVLKTFAM